MSVEPSELRKDQKVRVIIDASAFGGPQLTEGEVIYYDSLNQALTIIITRSTHHDIGDTNQYMFPHSHVSVEILYRQCGACPSHSVPSNDYLCAACRAQTP